MKHSKQLLDAPIFIHSLFRAGSTYLFEVFRRSDKNYCCYQESLHEMALFSRNEPKDLIVGFDLDEMRLNRHPSMDKPYFTELYEAWFKWKDVITEEMIYNAYFTKEASDEIGIPYWDSLINAAKGRPVFQECRTSNRIEFINQGIDSYHIYLWRNPWDQWWSYKVTPYFNMVNQVIIHSIKAPSSVKNLCAELNLPKYSGTDLAQTFAYYYSNPLTSEESYLVFYLLWCLALRSGMEHADLLLNIDLLSESANYRESILAQLKDKAKISGIDFSDCSVPHAHYTNKDISFFNNLEERVHNLLKEDGWTEDDLNAIQILRKEYQPQATQLIEDNLPIAAIVEQSGRARALAMRFETDLAQRVQRSNQEISQAEAKAQQAEAKAQQAEAKAQQAEAKAIKYSAELQAVYTSTSWRITTPLRKLSLLQKHLLTGVSAWVRFRRGSRPRRIAVIFARRIYVFINTSPALRNMVLPIISCYPRLYHALRNRFLNLAPQKIHREDIVPSSSIDFSKSTSDLPLSAPAQRYYQQLFRDSSDKRDKG